jgi:putative transposase
VDRNPLRAAMVGRAEAYPWSSASAHLSGSDEAGLLDFGELRQVRGFGNWREQMDAPMEADAIERLRLSTQTGAPIRSQKFVAELGKKFHRNVEFRKRGGQPKRASAAAAAS